MEALDSAVKEIVEDAAQLSEGDTQAEAVPDSEIREILRGLPDEKLERLRRKVYLYVLKHYERDDWLAEELTQEAFLRVFKGSRRWRPANRSLFWCLCGAAESIRSHIPRDKNQSLDEIDEKPRLNKSELSLLKETDCYLYEQLCGRLRESARGDPVLRRMVEFYIQDPDMKPRHMRALMPEVPKTTVKKKFQRLTGLIRELGEELKNG